MEPSISIKNINSEYQQEYDSFVNTQLDIDTHATTKKLIYVSKKISSRQMSIHLINNDDFQIRGNIIVYQFTGSFSIKLPQNLTISIPVHSIYWNGNISELIQNPDHWKLISNHSMLKGPCEFTVTNDNQLYLSLLQYDLIPGFEYKFFLVKQDEPLEHYVIKTPFTIQPTIPIEINIDMPEDIQSVSNKIPKTIYQTWKTREVPAFMKKYIDTWINWNPEYDYQLFSDEDCEQFIKKYFPDNVLSAFQKLNVGPYKADLWRYCVLYIKGGIYVDIDTVCLHPLKNIISHQDQFVSARDNPTGMNYIYQAFLASVPKHPFLKEAIDQCVKNIETNFIGENSLSMTGPGLLGKAINKILDRKPKSKFHVGNKTVNDYPFKLYSFNNHQQGIIYKGNSIIMTKTNEYMDYQKTNKIDFNYYYIQGQSSVFNQSI